MLLKISECICRDFKFFKGFSVILIVKSQQIFCPIFMNSTIKAINQSVKSKI